MTQTEADRTPETIRQFLMLLIVVFSSHHAMPPPRKKSGGSPNSTDEGGNTRTEFFASLRSKWTAGCWFDRHQSSEGSEARWVMNLLGSGNSAGSGSHCCEGSNPKHSIGVTAVRLHMLRRTNAEETSRQREESPPPPELFKLTSINGDMLASQEILGGLTAPLHPDP